MEKSQLAEALRSLNKDEFREFGKFVRSPYHNNRSEVIRFYDAVKKYYPSLESKGLESRKIFSAVYPGKKYSDVTMRKVISLTTNLVMEYIAVSGFRKYELEYNIKLLSELFERNLSSLFDKKAKSMEALLNKSKHTVEYYEAKSKYTSWLTEHLNNKSESATVPKYQNELDDFVEYFLIVLLMKYHRLRTMSKMYNAKYDFKLYKEVIEFLSKHDYKGSTLVSLYHNLAMLSSTEEEKYFIALMEFWDRSEDKLNDLMQHIIYVALYNHCINRKQKGEAEYHKLQFSITKKYFEKNIFPKDVGFIQQNLFEAVVQNAAKLKEFEWVTGFIKNYKSRLDPQTAEETIDYSFALIEFEKGNYEKSLKYLSTIQTERIMKKMGVKNLLIRIYFELGYTEELIQAIDSYRHYLHREKNITPQKLEMTTNFLNFVSELIKLGINITPENIFLIQKKVEKVPYFNLKEWVLEKTDELLKRRNK
ncbi:MAG: hypothetical protein HOP31_05965 [Ignavibacteria bacterium]|nr:hypothetical protein [Ignavibacteria bacterium]